VVFQTISLLVVWFLKKICIEFSLDLHQYIFPLFYSEDCEEGNTISREKVRNPTPEAIIMISAIIELQEEA